MVAPGISSDIIQLWIAGLTGLVVGLLLTRETNSFDKQMEKWIQKNRIEVPEEG